MTTEAPGSLKVLSVCHYILGGLTALGALASLWMVYAGIDPSVMGLNAENTTCNGGYCSEEELAIVVDMLFYMGLGSFVLCAVIAWVQITVGANLSNGTGRMFCIVVAAIECLNFPLGTILGIATILALVDNETKLYFEEA